MPRLYTKKTEREPPDPKTMEFAVKKVVDDGKSLRSTAFEYAISKTTLQRYVNKYKASKETNNQELPRFTPNYRSSQVFTAEEENLLASYLLQACKLHHGLTYKQCRKLAYEFASKNGLKYPELWNENGMAGVEWLKGFMCRNQNLSLRTPEPTSLARSTAFNHNVVNEFFDNLAAVYEKIDTNISPERIWNIDETALTTVHKPGRIISLKGSKQVGKMTSGERGILVTVCCSVNALGNSIPPFMIFPRKNFKAHMIANAPQGTLGVAHPSGWMTVENFVKFLEHFTKYVRCSKDHPVILIMDNHASHVSVESITFAKDNGITLLTIPPHTSHKLQPLDRGVYYPLKHNYNIACDNWMVNHPGTPMSIYNISVCLGFAFPRAFTPSNIISSFACTGIWPYNKAIFHEDEFLTSYVTDRPLPEPDIEGNHQPGPSDQSHTTPKTPTLAKKTNESRISLTPEEIAPFPKAKPRKTVGCTRKRGKTLILTSTPVKERIEREAAQRNKNTKRGTAQSCRKNLVPVKYSKASTSSTKPVTKKQVKQKKRKQISDSSASDCNEDGDQCSMSISPCISESTVDSNSDISSVISDSLDLPMLSSENGVQRLLVCAGSYVLVSLMGKKRVLHYAGQVVERKDNFCSSVQFLNRIGTDSTYKFVNSNEKLYDVDDNDILRVLPNPRSLEETTARNLMQLVFDFDFMPFNMA